MTQVYVLIRTYDYLEEGFSVVGVFSSLKLLREYVSTNYPKAILEDDGNYSYETKGTRDYNFTNNIYLNIHKIKLK